jgi:hypothetical protein
MNRKDMETVTNNIDIKINSYTTVRYRDIFIKTFIEFISHWFWWCCSAVMILSTVIQYHLGNTLGASLITCIPIIAVPIVCGISMCLISEF